jgi:hypothetical protein
VGLLISASRAMSSMVVLAYPLEKKSFLAALTIVSLRRARSRDLRFLMVAMWFRSVAVFRAIFLL